MSAGASADSLLDPQLPTNSEVSTTADTKRCAYHDLQRNRTMISL